MLKIMLDAGHGGKDPGACGIQGTMEKDITLTLVKKIGDRLSKMNLQVLYTRDADKFLSIAERTSLANKMRADYFISLHTNSATNQKAQGIEVYTYLLPDVVSQRLADAILYELIKNTKRANRGVKKANFGVIRETNMPAVLLEICFISNLEEEELLKKALFQGEVANSIVLGILNFINQREGENRETKTEILVHWGQGACNELKKKGIITSDKEPNSQVTWAELATVILKLLEKGPKV